MERRKNLRKPQLTHLYLYNPWGQERIFGNLSQGALFCSLGALFSYSSLPDYGKFMAISGGMLGLILGLYFIVK